MLLAAAMEAGRDLPDFAPDVMLVDLSQGQRGLCGALPRAGLRRRDALARRGGGCCAARAAARRARASRGPCASVRLMAACAGAARRRPRRCSTRSTCSAPSRAEERAAPRRRAWPRRLVAAGHAMVRQGEAGAVAVPAGRGRARDSRSRRPAGRDVLLDRLVPGAVFGEMSLLTGQPRSATVRGGDRGGGAANWREADLDPVLRARPALLEGLTAIMAERQARNTLRPDAARRAIARGADARGHPGAAEILLRRSADPEGASRRASAPLGAAARPGASMRAQRHSSTRIS